MSERVAMRDLVDHLQTRGLVAAAEIPGLEKELGERGVPWYLQALMAFGAWFAALFFVGFFAAGGLLSFRENSLIPVGLLLVAAATGVRRLSGHLFLQQFCLAVSIAGQILALLGAAQIGHYEVRTVAAMAVLLCVALYPLYPDPLHRFLTVVNALIWAIVQVFVLKEVQLIHGIVFAQTAALLILFTRRHVMTSLLPLGYALAVMLPATLILTAMPEIKVATVDAPSRAVLAGALVWVIVWAAGGNLKREPVLLALVGAVLLGVVGVAGLLAALVLLVIGYARWDRPMLGLGAASLATFLVIYYYELNASLDQKALILIGSGVVLLAGRFYMKRRAWGIA